MDKAVLLDWLAGTEWGSWPQPGGNAPDAVPGALMAVAEAADQQAAWRAYDNVLDAIGNNHDGTYYPVAIAVVPVLGRIIGQGGNWPTYAALNVLIDLYGSFDPQRGYEVYFDANGAGEEVAPALKEAIAGLSPILQEIAVDYRTGAERRAAARDLLEALSANGTGTPEP